MSALAFALFVTAIPMAMALGMRFTELRPALRGVATLAVTAGLVCAVLLNAGVGWLSFTTVFIVWAITTIAPLALGMAAWRTPDLIDSMQVEFNRMVEPYAGRPLSLLGWAHRIFDLAPSKFTGVRPVQ